MVTDVTERRSVKHTPTNYEIFEKNSLIFCPLYANNNLGHVGIIFREDFLYDSWKFQFKLKKYEQKQKIFLVIEQNNIYFPLPPMPCNGQSNGQFL